MTVITMNIKTYSELLTYKTFLDRYRYLRIGGQVGKDTFGYDRYLNQVLYHSDEWRNFRHKIIIRDNGCDLGCEGYDIYGRILIHHINPITVQDVLRRDPAIFDPENVICVSHNAHNAIHYGNEDLLITEPLERTPYDTCPWKQ